jgi:hypothetical protein
MQSSTIAMYAAAVWAWIKEFNIWSTQKTHPAIMAMPQKYEINQATRSAVTLRNTKSKMSAWRPY